MTSLETKYAVNSSMVRQARADGVRADIQGLRAVAVLSVLAYHLWPHMLRGGYVGVDVFFVLSGFLITAHLLKQPPTTAQSMVQFWGRRIRRLLPAATVVLLATLAASLVWLPETMLPRVAKDAAAAAVYAENWVLAGNATDYLASEDAASPLQHYWSLSVEEQFYVFWPLLIGALFLLSRRPRPARVLTLGLGGLFLASLSWSAYLTSHDPSRAYFVTPTRIWELALGGLVALMFYLGIEPKRRSVRLVAAWLGLAMIGYAVVAFSSATPFPGLAALVPTVGAALVLLANGDRLPGSPRAFLSNRMSQYVGAVSYSTYLWHWPLIVLAPFVLDRTIFWPDKVAIALLSIVLAAMTKRWVEDPVRRDPRLISSLMGTFAVGTLCISVVLVGGAASALTLEKKTEATAERVADGLREHAPCFGANAVRSTTCDPAGEELLTTPLFAKSDRPDVYARNCLAGGGLTTHPVCTFGSKDAPTRLALFGNSHAAHWQPALAEATERGEWQITTYLEAGGYPVDAPISLPTPELVKNYQDWAARAISDVHNGDFDLVVMSNVAMRPLAGVAKADQHKKLKEAYGRTLKALTSGGTPVLVIRDVPKMTGNVPDCVDAHNQDVNSCTRPAKDAIRADPAVDAAREDKSGLVSVVDVSSLICHDGVCRSVVGGVIVFLDGKGHMSKTFARTLAPEITAAVRKRIN